MNKMLLGVLFLVADMDITPMPGMVIGLIPDFVGYLLLWQGCKDFMELNKYFGRVSVVSQILMVFSGLTYLNRAVNLLPATNALNFILETVSVAGMLIILFWIVKGFLTVEDTIQFELKSTMLLYIWWGLLIVSVARLVTNTIAYVGGAFGIAAFVLSVVYVIALFRTKCYYDDAMAEIEKE